MPESLVPFAANDRLPGMPRREAFAAEFFALLSERIARFTMGDSSSVRAETAEQIGRSLQYCISLALRASKEPQTEARSTRELYESGLAEARRLTRRAKMLLKQAETLRPPVENVGFRDTLSALPEFFRRYDPEFFACEIPCDIDYPLCTPVPEMLSGVDYLLEYLRRLNAESAFLRRFPAPLLAIAYERHYGDDGLLVNLYEPVAAAAAGRALVDRAVAIYGETGTPLAVIPRIGGGTDAAYAALSGKPVIESLGLPGYGYHSDEAEYVMIDAIPRRLYLAARLIMDLSSARK